MNGKQLSLVAGAGSLALLIGAFGFQAAGYAPCELCILQRWPHAAAIVVAGLIFLTGRVKGLAWLGALAAAVACGLAIYHTGVELNWWEGPTHCSGGVGGLASMSTQDLMSQLQSAPVVRCDEVAWSLFGLSMASWNGIFSAMLTGIWVAAARRG
ncbi:disulfide bond formation protein B [Paracoccus caeni]|uniref:Disulfide bond formation protein B n=1 Tax=Paracoccus caeni TaxID=657651 RepID=A0A934SJX5_9RHOB|nr:disulfide bond formation protein B [Paracoccus caeni]MBK4215788.1 disulfide bond formation protein B [Paracoccus caeni]